MLYLALDEDPGAGSLSLGAHNPLKRSSEMAGASYVFLTLYSPIEVSAWLVIVFKNIYQADGWMDGWKDLIEYLM